MLNNVSKYALGVAGFGVLAAIVSDDRAAALLLVGIALVAALIAFGEARALGPDLAPFVAADEPVTSTPVDLADAPRGSMGPMIVGLSAAVAVSGGAMGPRYLIAGVLGAIVGTGVWLFDTYRAPGVLHPRDAKNVDNRLLGPIALPVGAFLLAITIAYSFSRVLLAVNETASWVLAFIVAAVLLTILSLIATRGAATKVVAGVAGLGIVGVLVAGGAGASIGERSFESKATVIPTATLTAHMIAYDRTVIGLPANRDVDVVFTNLDVGTFHNVAIYTDDVSSSPEFNGKPIAKGKAVYQFHTPAAGTYKFVCDFHPAMTGELRVTGGSN